MKKFEVGDLVYVPSEVVIYSESLTHKLKEPINLLITGEKEGCYEVFYENKKWLVNRSSVYKVG